MNHAIRTDTRWRRMHCILAISLIINGLSLFADSDDKEYLISLPNENVKDMTSRNSAGTATTSQRARNAKETKGSTLKNVQYEDSLQAVVYDLKRMRDGRANREFPDDPGNGTYRDDFLSPLMKILQPFVNGSWQKTYDSRGMSYTELNKYYRPSASVRSSVFYTDENRRSELAAGDFSCNGDLKPKAWVCIYSGYVTAPFTGKFRFVGTGDECLVVRFRQMIALDHGCVSATLGVSLNDAIRKRLSSSLSGSKKNPIGRKMPSTSNYSSFYTENKLETCIPSFTTLLYAKGPVLDVKKGEVIPIEILTSDLGGNFHHALFFERLDAAGKPRGNSMLLNVFRTSNRLPSLFSDRSFSDFNKAGPVWNVVDAKGKPIPLRKSAAETKNGDVKKTVPTTTPATSSGESARKTDAKKKETSSSTPATSSSTAASSSTPVKTNDNGKAGRKQKFNPFGYTQPLPEDD